MFYPEVQRRALLKSLGLGGAAAFLPSLRRPARAADFQIPQRVIFFYTIQGLLRPLWEPDGNENDFKLGTLNKPLEPLKDKAIFLSGLDFKSKELFGGGGNGHLSGTIHVLTSNKPASVKSKSVGPSFDQFLVSKINEGGPKTLVPSIELVINGNGNNGSRIKAESDAICYARPGESLPFSYDAMDVYKRLFPNDSLPGGAGGGPSPADLKRKSVLDFVANEFTSTANRLPKIEKDKLLAHGQAIRDMEMRLALNETVGDLSDACKLPDKADLDIGSYRARSQDDWFEKGEARARMVVNAMACDLTRVATVAVGMPPIDVSDQHDLMHRTSDGNDNRVKNAQIKYFELFNRFGQLLDEVKESDGQTLLDHTALVWIGQIANGNHDKNNHKWTMLGSLGNKFKRVDTLSWVVSPTVIYTRPSPTPWGSTSTSSVTPMHVTGRLADFNEGSVGAMTNVNRGP